MALTMCLVSLTPGKPPFSHAPRLFPQAWVFSAPKTFPAPFLSSQKTLLLVLALRGAGGVLLSPRFTLSTKQGQRLFFKLFSANGHPDNKTSTD